MKYKIFRKDTTVISVVYQPGYSEEILAYDGTLLAIAHHPTRIIAIASKEFGRVLSPDLESVDTYLKDAVLISEGEVERN